MILTLLAALAASLDAEPRDWELPPALKHGIPQPLPSGDPSIHGMYDLEDLVILRPQGTELQDGFSYGAFSRAVEAAIQDREPYDFVCIVHSDQLPTQFSGAAAFHLSYNNLELFGTGKYAVSNPQYDLKAGLWMTYPSYRLPYAMQS